MTIRSRSAFFPAALALSLALSAAVQSQSRRGITETDLLAFTWAADPQISPDGEQVVFTRVVVNQQKDDYETSLWLVPVSGNAAPRPLTSGTRDSSARWAPDGRRIAFVRAVERDGRPQPAQIHLLAMDGGEAKALTDVARGAGNPVWSPDGTRLAFTSTTTPEDRKDAAKPATPPSDVRVITSGVYRANGGGWNDPDRPAHLWVTDLEGKSTQVTSGRFGEGGQIWSKDGTRLFFTSTRVDDAYYLPGDANIYAVPASGGAITQVASIDGMIGGLSLSPDGASIAFVGTLNGKPDRSYDQPDLFVVKLGSSAAPVNLTGSYDFDIAGGVGGDQAPPRGRRDAGADLVSRRTRDHGGRRRAGRRQPAAFRRRDRHPATGAQRGAHGAIVHGDARCPAGRRARVDAGQHRRSLRRGQRGVERAAPDHARQRRAIQEPQAQRARGDLVDEL
jgi:Tol biopolymer transport system component